MTDRPRLHVIDGTPQETAGKKRARSPSPEQLITCHRCGGREMLETKVGMVFRNGKAAGGTKQIICALCYSKGERVVLA